MLLTAASWLIGSRVGRMVSIAFIALAVVGWLRWDAVQDERRRAEAEANKARLETIERKREIERDVREMDDDGLRDCLRGLRC